MISENIIHGLIIEKYNRTTMRIKIESHPTHTNITCIGLQNAWQSNSNRFLDNERAHIVPGLGVMFSMGPITVGELLGLPAPTVKLMKTS